MKFYRPLLFLLLICIGCPVLSNADQLEDANAAINIGDFTRASELLQPLAEEGNEEAQTRLGAMYINGQGVERDINKGLSWVMRAANRGDMTARRVAFKVCLDLVNQGDTSLLFNLGYMCLEGWGGEHSAGTCFGWLENAGKSGHEQSLRLLIKIYEEGLYGITPNEERVTYWRNLRADFAAGLDGKWEGSVSVGPEPPPMVLTYKFKTDGGKLTGTTGSDSGGESRISDGKIDGTDFSFTVNVRSAFGGMKINYTGIFYGDMIKLTYTTEIGSSRPPGRSYKNRFGATDTDGVESLPITFTARRAEQK